MLNLSINKNFVKANDVATFDLKDEQGNVVTFAFKYEDDVLENEVAIFENDCTGNLIVTTEADKLNAMLDTLSIDTYDFNDIAEALYLDHMDFIGGFIESYENNVDVV